MTALLLLSAISTASPPSIETRRAVASAVRGAGGDDLGLSIRRPADAPTPSPGSDGTYVAETRPVAFGGGCLAHRYFVVIPARENGASPPPQVTAYGIVSFARGCVNQHASSFAQVQPAGLPEDELRSAMTSIAAGWTSAPDKRIRCGRLAAGVSCPDTARALASLAPLADLKLVERSPSGLRAVLTAKQRQVTEVTLPAGSPGEVVVEQRQPAPF